MGLEAATHINQLNPLNPIGGADPVAQGDDHIRMVKQVLTADLPNIGGAVTLTHTEINDAARKSVANVLTAALSGASAPIVLSSGAPGIIYRETDGAANNQYWRTYVGSETFFETVVNDAQSVETVWLRVDRTGTVVDSIALTATSITFNGLPISSYARTVVDNTFTIGQTVSATNPYFRLNETDAAANARRWLIDAEGGAFRAFAVNDADSVFTQWFNVARTGTVVDSISLTATALTFSGVPTFTSGDVIVQHASQPSFRLSVAGTIRGILEYVEGSSVLNLDSDGAIAFKPNNTEKMRIEAGGQIYGVSIHNNAGGASGATNGYIASGTYTPTLTGVTNVAASTSAVCQWMRVGNVVTVSGRIAVDPTVAAPTTLGVSLPIASNFASNIQCAGTSVRVTTLGGGAPNEAGVIAADAVNDRAEISWIAADPANSTLVFQFTYLVV